MTLRILLGLALSTGCISGAERVAAMGPVPVPGHVRVHVEADDGSVRVFTADIAQVEMRGR